MNKNIHQHGRVTRIDSNYRKYVMVSCKDCGTEYEKRRDSLAWWGGQCQSCANREVSNRPEQKERIRRVLERTKAQPGYHAKLVQSHLDSPYKGELHPSWKGGKPSCIDCGKLLSRYDATRCKRCYIKTSIDVKFSVARRREISKAQKGPGGNGWRGGIAKANDIIHHSLDYKLWRRAVFARDKWTCQECGGSKGVHLEAHHIKPFSEYPELRLDVGNGVALCKDCHKKTDSYGWKQLHKLRKQSEQARSG